MSGASALPNDINVLLSPSQRRSIPPSFHGDAATLTATILSVYDLPWREPPLQVRLTVGSHTVATGPPTQRHKDRNSFQFGGTPSSSNNIASYEASRRLVVRKSTLAELYQDTALLHVVYASSPSSVLSEHTLSASYPLHQLKIHETSWLILQLSPDKEKSIVLSNGSTAEHEGDNFNQDEPPTVRLQLTLSGPYRPQVRAILHAANIWLGWVDSLEAALSKWQVDWRWIWIPLAPISAVLVVASPVLIGATLVTLPLLWPVFLLLAALGAAIFASSVLLYASSSAGREAVVQPLLHTVLAAPLGQALVYDVGVTPATLCRPWLPDATNLAHRLALSLLIDALGNSSYLLPGAGELIDVLYAPLQTTLLAALYPNEMLLQHVSLWEELLPGTDVVPSATLAWCRAHGLPWLLQQQF